MNVHDSLFVREHASVPAHREHLPHSWRRVSRFRREQIIDLLRALQRRHQLGYLFISHDLKVVRAMAHYVLVMKDGDVVEEGPVADIFDAPKSDYTATLMRAAFEL